MDTVVEFTKSDSFEMIFVFLIGAFGYGLLELFWRGKTHYSMLITGGLCFFVIYFFNLRFADKSLIFKCLAAMAVITALELLAGIVVNKIFSLRVWDYSDLPYNFMGQICLLYSTFWFCLGLPLAYIVPALRRFIMW